MPPSQPLPVTASPSTEPQRQKTPVSGGRLDKFRPWSREDLLARISTFKIHTWLIQSPKLSPVKCARSGWINVDCSKLRCTACSAVLIAELPEDLTDSEETLWIERLGQQLQSSHSGSCPWKGHECAASVYSVPLATSKETVDDLCQQAADILAFSDHFPDIEHPLTAFQSSLLRALAAPVLELSASKSGESRPDDDQVMASLVLALFGWRKDLSIPRPTVKCELCFRSVGLWLFGKKNASAKEGADAAGRAEMPGAEPRAFVVDGEHRAFCYWAHGSDADSKQSQSTRETLKADVSGAPTQQSTTDGTSNIPGWQNIIASLLRAKAMGVGRYAGASESGSGSGSSSAEYISSTDGGESDSSIEEVGASRRQVDKISGPKALQQLKPFNISAISSAAAAFGIPFSSSLLARAVQRLSAATAGVAESGGAAVLMTKDIGDRAKWDVGNSGGRTQIDASDADAEPGPDAAPNVDMASDRQEEYESRIADFAADIEDEIPAAPIDTSGLESLLGESTLADALEDPSKASAILEYIKSLIRANHPSSDP
ncbi:hypothetical protein LPJ56_003542 [Coemansia sp. RSA 2599]|nr:hypothetical protein LPJ56_003542 [Coemansia sp. RSA 2599]